MLDHFMNHGHLFSSVWVRFRLTLLHTTKNGKYGQIKWALDAKKTMLAFDNNIKKSLSDLKWPVF